MKKGLKIFLIIIFLGVLILISKQSNSEKKTSLKNPNLQKYAFDVLAKCQTEKYRPGCYEKEIPKLMDDISMEDAFKVTSIVQGEDKSYTYCHVLGHKLSAREIDKDPSKWKEVVTRCPSGICSNGCIHGGFQEKFRSENFTDEQIQQLKPDLTDLCEVRGSWNPTGLEQASCYHALGHLTMYLTSADIQKSTTLCEEVSIKKDGRDFSQLCFDGAFMQIYQPLEPDDIALIKGKEVIKDKVDSFCAEFSGKKKGSCLSESWPLYRQELINDPSELVRFCSKEEKDQQERCFMGLFYVLTAQFNFDSERIKNYCLNLPENLSGKCFANAASRMIETDYRNIYSAVEFCSSSKTDFNKNACYEELVKYSTYNFHAGSEEFFTLCNGLPSPWKTQCLDKK